MRPIYSAEYKQLKKAVRKTYSRSGTLTFLCIRPTKVVASELQKNATNLRNLCNRPSDTVTFFNEVCIRPTVHRTNSSLKLLKNHVRVGPKYCRTDVIQLFLIIQDRMLHRTPTCFFSLLFTKKDGQQIFQ